MTTTAFLTPQLSHKFAWGPEGTPRRSKRAKTTSGRGLTTSAQGATSLSFRRVVMSPVEKIPFADSTNTSLTLSIRVVQISSEKLSGFGNSSTLESGFGKNHFRKTRA